MLSDSGHHQINAFADFFTGIDRTAPFRGIGLAQRHAGVGDGQAVPIAAGFDALGREQVAHGYAFFDAALKLFQPRRHFFTRAAVDHVHRSAEAP